MKLDRLYIYSAASLVLMTGLAKIVSASGDAGILGRHDPVFGMPFRVLFWATGLIEIAVAVACLFLLKRVGVSALLLCWLSTGFLLYRVGLYFIGYRKPCPCLGTITDAIHISPSTADLAMKVVFLYLLVGSYTTLIYARRHIDTATFVS
jgi:hypothetical protein